MREKRTKDFVEKLVKSSVQILKEADKREGGEADVPAIVSFVEKLIEATVYEALTKHTENGKAPMTKSAYEKTRREYERAKLSICEAAANGVSSAMYKFTEKSLDLYCTINIVPPTANRKPV